MTPKTEKLEMLADKWEELGLDNNLETLFDFYSIFQIKEKKTDDEIVDIIINENKLGLRMFETLLLSKQKEIFEKICYQYHKNLNSRNFEKLISILSTTYILDFLGIVSRINEELLLIFYRIRHKDINFILNQLYGKITK